MTRINCIPVEELEDKHLLAEYRELRAAIEAIIAVPLYAREALEGK